MKKISEKKALEMVFGKNNTMVIVQTYVYVRVAHLDTNTIETTPFAFYGDYSKESKEKLVAYVQAGYTSYFKNHDIVILTIDRVTVRKTEYEFYNSTIEAYGRVKHDDYILDSDNEIKIDDFEVEIEDI